MGKNWEDIARKRRVGEKVLLKSLEGEVWVRPHKYSIDDQSELLEIALEQGLDLPPEITKKLGQAAQDGAENGVEMFGALDLADRQTVLRHLAQKSVSGPYIRKVMLAGIAEYGIDGEDEVLSWDTEVVEKMMQYSDVATEIVEIAQRFNGPLAKGSAKSSAT